MNSIAPRLVIFLFFTLSVACKKKDNPAPVIVKQVPADTVKIPPVQEKSLVPIKLESDKGIITLKYLEQTGNLTDIENSDGTRESYAYNTDNQLKRYDRYSKGEKVYTVDYLRDKQGNVIQGNQYMVEYNGARVTPTGTYKIEYIENKISKVTWYDNNNQVISESLRTYTASGKIEKITTKGQHAGVYTYSFDDKNGWCKQVNFNQILSIESLNNLFLSSNGNMLKFNEEAVSASELSYVYTYNSDNYPTSWVQSDVKGVKTTYKITNR
jgi:hypothetical protein